MQKQIINFSLKSVIGQLWKMKFLTLFALLSIILKSISTTAATYLGANLINALFGDLNSLKLYIWLFVASFTITIVFTVLWKFLNNRIKQKIVNNLIKQFLFNVVLNNATSWNSVNNETKIAIVGKNIEEIVGYYHLKIFAFFSNIFFVVTNLIALGLLLPIAFSYVTPFIVLLILGQLSMLAIYSKVGKMANEQTHTSANAVIKAFDNFLLVKRNNYIANNQKFFIRSEQKVLKLGNKINQIIAIVILINVGANGLLMGLSLFLTILSAIWQGGVTFGQIMAVFVLAAAIFSTTISITDIFAQIGQTKSQLKDIALLVKNLDFENLEVEMITKLNLTFKLQTKKVKNYNIQKGDKVLIVGSNGSGKSLLLKHLSGNFLVKNLEISVNDQKVTNKNIFDLQKHFYYNSNLNYFEILSLKENLDFEKQNNWQRLDYLIKHFNLSHLDLDSPLDLANLKLSEGEKQRLQIIRTLLSTKEVLIFDEAFANIDKTNKEIVYDYLLNHEPRSIFIVSHGFDQKQYGQKINHLINSDELALELGGDNVK